MPTGEDDCPDATGAPDSDEADFCDPAIANARTISWEKRRNSNGQLAGFATFKLGGASGPFACTGDTTNPVEILDDGPYDTDSTDGEIVLENICAGAYTVTETIAPAGLSPDPDPTRAVDVTSADDTIGTQGSAQDCSTSSPFGDPVPGTDTDEADFCNPTFNARTISWEKRRNTNGALVGGATFTVGGAGIGLSPAPATPRTRSKWWTAAPWTPTGLRARLSLATCPGAYTVTRPLLPPGSAGSGSDARGQRDRGERHDRDTGQRAGVLDLEPLRRPVPGTDTDEADFCNPAFNARTISWEKRGHNNGQLVGGATFTIGGVSSGPFACAGDSTNPVEVVDNGAIDTDGTNGEIVVTNVCPGSYTVTETIAPPDRALDPDNTRAVNVTAGNDTIGTQGTAQECSTSSPFGDPVPGTDTDEADFCNPQVIVGSIAWEKRSHVNGALLGGASFSVLGSSSGPRSCLGDAINPIAVADDGANDFTSAAGQVLFENVCPGTYTVTETFPPSTLSRRSRLHQVRDRRGYGDRRSDRHPGHCAGVLDLEPVRRPRSRNGRGRGRLLRPARADERRSARSRRRVRDERGHDSRPRRDGSRAEQQPSRQRHGRRRGHPHRDRRQQSSRRDRLAGRGHDHLHANKQPLR